MRDRKRTVVSIAALLLVVGSAAACSSGSSGSSSSGGATASPASSGTPSGGASPGGAASGGTPMSVADLAMYTGSDRTQKLVAGAEQEGALGIYDSNTAVKAAGEEFHKLYPKISVTTYLAPDAQILTRLKSEFAANKVGGDVLSLMDQDSVIANNAGYIQEFKSPVLDAYTGQFIGKGKQGGAIYVADRYGPTAIAWNTNLVKDPPKTLDDLLKPEFKGKMVLNSHSSGTNWLGEVLTAKGQDFIDKLAAQKVSVQNVSAAAETELVGSGQAALGLDISISDVLSRQAKGEPLSWAPICPCDSSIGSSSLISKAPHPYAGLLFLDWLHSLDGQKFMVSQGFFSPRADAPVPGYGKITFDMVDLGSQYTPEQYQQNYATWQKLLKTKFEQ